MCFIFFSMVNDIVRYSMNKNDYNGLLNYNDDLI